MLLDLYERTTLNGHDAPKLSTMIISKISAMIHLIFCAHTAFKDRGYRADGQNGWRQTGKDRFAAVIIYIIPQIRRKVNIPVLFAPVGISPAAAVADVKVLGIPHEVLGEEVADAYDRPAAH